MLHIMLVKKTNKEHANNKKTQGESEPQDIASTTIVAIL